MNRRQADVVTGAVVGSVVLLGVVTVVQFSLTGGPMRGKMGAVPAMALFGPLLMSLVVASILGGIYVFARGRVFPTGTDRTTGTDDSRAPDEDEMPDLGSAGTGPEDPATRRNVLNVLPEDERRILDPVLESPGVTQIEVRDRSGFSKSKVSQTITDLEGRGLLYRETQGRTYRVYPADDINKRF